MTNYMIPKMIVFGVMLISTVWSNEHNKIGDDNTLVDASTPFECDSGHPIGVGWVCDKTSQCNDVSDETGCNECDSRFEDDGAYFDSSALCIQTQSYCRCKECCWYKNDGEKVYKNIDGETKSTMSESGECQQDYTKGLYAESVESCDQSESVTSSIGLSSMFESSTKKRISVNWICDRWRDLKDLSDEANCSQCPSRFQCNGAHYVPGKLCIQRQSTCMCTRSCWYEENDQKIYRAIDEITESNMSDDGRCQ